MEIRKYNNCEFSDCGKILSNNEIDLFEKKKNIIFPSDYRQFLKEIDGGIPYIKNVFYLHEQPSADIGVQNTNYDYYIDDDCFYVDELFGLFPTEGGTSILFLTEHLYILDVPDSRSFIMIGNVESLPLYMSLSSQYYGNIFLGEYPFGTFDPSTSNNSENNDLFEIHIDDRIAHTFTGFLNMLQKHI